MRNAETGQSIRSQLVLAVLFPSICFGLLTVLVSVTAMRQLSDQSVQQQSLAVARVVAGTVNQDAPLPRAGLPHTLASLRPTPNTRLYVVDRQGRLAGPQAIPGADAATTTRKGGPLPADTADFSDDRRLLQILSTGQPGSLVRPASPGGDELVTAVSPLGQRGLSLSSR